MSLLVTILNELSYRYMRFKQALRELKNVSRKDNDAHKMMRPSMSWPISLAFIAVLGAILALWHETKIER